MNLLMWNLKPCIFCDGNESILNNIMGCNLFPTMGAMNIFVGSKGCPQMQWVNLRVKRWESPNKGTTQNKKHQRPNRKMEWLGKQKIMHLSPAYACP
jgi:hypothetical protein